jgi:hypothetical protein
MWLCTIYGFFSVASAENKDASIDRDNVMVRARRRQHLENLKMRFPSLAKAEILVWPKRDYHYRMIVPKKDWVTAVCAMAEEQEWNSFKAKVGQQLGAEERDYQKALNAVWSTMQVLQKGLKH